MSTTDLTASVQVSVRQADGCVAEDLEWASAPLDLLRNAHPWRTFRWYKGQQHYSGTYWAATERDHVIYESRLELARLLFADFAPDVRHVVAQPFLLKAVVEGRLRRHIPDYLLLTDDGPVVVDVKPRHRLERPKVRRGRHTPFAAGGVTDRIGPPGSERCCPRCLAEGPRRHHRPHKRVRRLAAAGATANRPDPRLPPA
ncbi:TnsA-like heteromeric transposase endonuclease subunit [Streptomyces sp. NPDC048590]|uniref:TnsA-like heteromeric transposase endonuclease subunit n=1 Tax=Streptomyces sp. NPDC048590 TaxID=3365574 RepID=UPI003721378F